MITFSQTLNLEELDNFSPAISDKGYKIELRIDSNKLDFLCNRENRIIEKLYPVIDKIISVHAPASSLNIASKDDFIREYSIKRIIQGIDFASLLNAKEYVFHTTYIPLITRKSYEKWINKALPVFERIINECKKNDIIPVLENTYETDTDVLKTIFNNFQELNFCLDIGHVYCFSNLGFNEWLDEFDNKLRVIHIHDNDKDEDSHKDLLSGKINFIKLFERIEDKNIRINLETSAHSFLENSSRLEKLIEHGRQSEKCL